MTESEWWVFFFSKLSTAYRDPLVLPKWSNQISASSEHVPLKKNKKNAATITETDGSPMKQAPCVDLKCGDSTPQFSSVFQDYTRSLLIPTRC